MYNLLSFISNLLFKLVNLVLHSFTSVICYLYILQKIVVQSYFYRQFRITTVAVISNIDQSM